MVLIGAHSDHSLLEVLTVRQLVDSFSDRRAYLLIQIAFHFLVNLLYRSILNLFRRDAGVHQIDFLSVNSCTFSCVNIALLLIATVI